MSSLSKVAILGPGLLGGSIALALREHSPRTHVAVWGRRAEAVAGVRSAQIAHTASMDLREIVEGADLAVLCVPIGAMRGIAETIALQLPPQALVTDVGSVKQTVVEQLTPIFADRCRFIGSHPMAGSEQAGLGAARADLFERAICILTPDRRTDPAAATDAATFWQLLGCRTTTLSPADHDAAVAAISHLPHMVAAALIDFIATKNPAALALCGPGFRDTTRIASGPAEMWTEIALTNRLPLRSALDGMIEKLRELVTLLDANDPTAMNQFLSAAKAHRDRLCQ